MLLLKVCLHMCVCMCVCVCVFRGGWARYLLLVQFIFWYNSFQSYQQVRDFAVPTMQLAGFPFSCALVCHRRPPYFH